MDSFGSQSLRVIVKPPACFFLYCRKSLILCIIVDKMQLVLAYVKKKQYLCTAKVLVYDKTLLTLFDRRHVAPVE